MKLLRLLAFLLALAPGLASASSGELISIDGKQPFAPQADRAYVLLRLQAKGNITVDLMRVPTDAELAAWRSARSAAFAKAEPGLRAKREAVLARKAAAERDGKPFGEAVPPDPSVETFPFAYTPVQNLSPVETGHALERTADTRTILLSAVPGRYVLYGIGWGRALATCLCLGSISFEAPAGKVVDLGEVAIDYVGGLDKSKVPELEGESGLGFSMNGHIGQFAAVLRPAAASNPKPGLLAGVDTMPADLRAQGKFVSPWAFSINRLVAIPGVLGYDRGDVLDLRSGKLAPNQY